MKNLFKFLTSKPEQVQDRNNTSSIEPEPHTHNWEIIVKTYAPPMGDVKGITNLLFVCSLCQEFKRVEMIGSDETQLEDIIVKVETFGQQLFRYNNNFYVISKYAPPVQSNIPVR